jgi:hypothetical protein
LDYVLAVAVLTAPTGSDCPAHSPLTEHRCLGRVLKDVALHWELLDPRETNAFFRRPDDFPVDVQLLRRRYRLLAEAPFCSDALRFPTREACCELLTFNRAYHRGLKQRQEAVGTQGNSHLALQEAEQLYRIWDLVREARSDCYYVSVRRQALLALRQALGSEDYYKGQLPPHVPVWRFDRRD